MDVTAANPDRVCLQVPAHFLSFKTQMSPSEFEKPRTGGFAQGPVAGAVQWGQGDLSENNPQEKGEAGDKLGAANSATSPLGNCSLNPLHRPGEFPLCE